MKLHGLQHQAKHFVSQNASGILTGVGVTGTVATAILTGRAAFKTGQLMTRYEQLREADPSVVEPMTTQEKARAIGPLFIPPVAVGGLTITAIIMSNRMSASRAAALVAAYSISEGRYEEYRKKVEEKLGVNKERGVRDAIAQDRVTNDPPSKEVIILAGGDVLCYDMLTGRYFRGSVESIKKAENRLNQELFNCQYASLTFFYEQIGLRPTDFTDEVGWNQAMTGNLEVSFSTVKSPDDQPCIAINFVPAPRSDYAQVY